MRKFESNVKGGNFVDVDTGKNTNIKIHFDKIEHINYRKGSDGEKYLFRSIHSSTSQSAEFDVENGILYTVNSSDMLNMSVNLSDAAVKRLKKNIEKRYDLR